MVQDSIELLYKDLRTQLPACLASIIGRVEFVLMDAWPKMDDTQQQRVARDTLRWLQNNRTPVMQAWTRHALGGLRRRADDASANNQPTDLSFLTLMDDDGLDVVSSRSAAISSISHRCEKYVNEVEAELEILQSEDPTINAQVVSASALLEALQNALTELELSTERQLALTIALPEPAKAYFIPYYQRLKKLLAAKRQQAQRSVTTEAAAPAPSQPTPAVSSNRSELARGLAQRLQGLGDEMQMLPGETDAQRLQSVVEQHFDAKAYAALSVAQRKAIDHVEGMYFKALANANLSERFRAELKALMEPVLVQELTRPEQFEDPHSPVRLFINLLVKIGIHDQLQPLEAFAKVQAAVKRVVTERGGESEGFRQGAQVLYNLLQQRTDHDGRDRARAMELVAEEINEMKAARRLPIVIQQVIGYLLEPWMVTCYECYGESSKAAISANMMARLLFKTSDYVALLPNDPERKRLEADVLSHATAWASLSRHPADLTNRVLSDLRAYYAAGAKNLMIG